mmetsp:Transcript_27438/g.88190  ORF Transcript_27438/g.88190 Transcript_27438/m.88190 type:complete len:243 (+) Transcript_27438:1322-2050(+)
MHSMLNATADTTSHTATSELRQLPVVSGSMVSGLKCPKSVMPNAMELSTISVRMTASNTLLVTSLTTARRNGLLVGKQNSALSANLYTRPWKRKLGACLRDAESSGVGVRPPSPPPCSLLSACMLHLAAPCSRKPNGSAPERPSLPPNPAAPPAPPAAAPSRRSGESRSPSPLVTRSPPSRSFLPYVWRSPPIKLDGSSRSPPSSLAHSPASSPYASVPAWWAAVSPCTTPCAPLPATARSG